MKMEKKVIQALKKVIDPELGLNVVDLGLIYQVKIKSETAFILMTLTSPGCPYADMFLDLVVGAVKKVHGVKKVKVDLTFNPLWNPDKLDSKVRIKLGL